jgi:hypothetical protein
MNSNFSQDVENEKDDDNEVFLFDLVDVCWCDFAYLHDIQSLANDKDNEVYQTLATLVSEIPGKNVERKRHCRQTKNTNNTPVQRRH